MFDLHVKGNANSKFPKTFHGAQLEPYVSVWLLKLCAMSRWNNESDEEPDGADTVDVVTGQALEQSADAVKALEVEFVALI